MCFALFAPLFLMGCCVLFSWEGEQQIHCAGRGLQTMPWASGSSRVCFPDACASLNCSVYYSCSKGGRTVKWWEKKMTKLSGIECFTTTMRSSKAFITVNNQCPLFFVPRLIWWPLKVSRCWVELGCLLLACPHCVLLPPFSSRPTGYYAGF